LDLTALLRKLTPVVIEDGLRLKRDDLFFLEEGSNIRGGKLRQCLSLVTTVAARRLITIGSIHSPQPAIVAYVAHKLGLGCTVLVAGKQDTLPLVLARSLGAEIKRCSSGRHSVLSSRARQLASPDDFVVPFGMRPQTPDVLFYDTSAAQIQNVPNEIDTIVITTGSGTTATILAYGLWLEQCARPRLVLVNVGPDRRQQILDILSKLDPECGRFAARVGFMATFPLGGTPGFRYEVRSEFNVGKIQLNPLYEGKAFRWYINNIDFDRERTLFWIVGPPIC
jgi:L-cysteate sulfo-lyase